MILHENGLEDREKLKTCILIVDFFIILSLRQVFLVSTSNNVPLTLFIRLDMKKLTKLIHYKFYVLSNCFLWTVIHQTSKICYIKFLTLSRNFDMKF